MLKIYKAQVVRTSIEFDEKNMFRKYFKHLSNDEIALIIKMGYRSDVLQERMKDEIYRRVYKMIVDIIKNRFSWSPFEFNEMLSIAYMGVDHAIKKWVPEMGNITTIIYDYIRKYINRHITKHGYNIKLPVVIESYNKINDTDQYKNFEHMKNMDDIDDHDRKKSSDFTVRNESEFFGLLCDSLNDFLKENYPSPIANFLHYFVVYGDITSALFGIPLKKLDELEKSIISS
mgnify:CR=1 FL=1